MKTDISKRATFAGSGRRFIINTLINGSLSYPRNYFYLSPLISFSGEVNFTNYGRINLRCILYRSVENSYRLSEIELARQWSLNVVDDKIIGSYFINEPLSGIKCNDIDALGILLETVRSNNTRLIFRRYFATKNVKKRISRVKFRAIVVGIRSFVDETLPLNFRKLFHRKCRLFRGVTQIRPRVSTRVTRRKKKNRSFRNSP